MTIWMGSVLALLPALLIPVCLACRGPLGGRLAAVLLATTMTTLILALMTFAFDQPAFMDLPLTLALLAAPGALVMALFVERWL